MLFPTFCNLGLPGAKGSVCFWVFICDDLVVFSYADSFIFVHASVRHTSTKAHHDHDDVDDDDDDDDDDAVTMMMTEC